MESSKKGTEYLKELLLQVGIINGERYTLKEKDKFIEFINNFTEKENLSLDIEKKHHSQYLKVGNFKSAKKILVVPYDTPLRKINEFREYFPFDTERILKEKKINLFIKGFIDILFIIFLIFLYLIFIKYNFFIKIITAVIAVFTLFVVLNLNKNRSAKVNMIYNSASLALALSIISSKSKNDFALLLVDDYYENINWIKYIQESLKEYSEKMLFIENMAVGEKLLISDQELFDVFSRKTPGKVELYTNHSWPINTMHLGYVENNQLRIDNPGVNKDIKVDVNRLEKIEETLKMSV